jgi:uncharacterized protein involved in outer membrane biogenesis
VRRWIAIAAVALVVLLGVVALAAVNLNTWLNANRALVAERVKQALGREVSFGEVGLSLAGGLGVRVSDLRVGDDPAFSREDFLRSDVVDVVVRIWPALFGKIEVERVVLRAPALTVIRTAKGLSIDSLGGAGAASPPPAAGEAGPPAAFFVALVDVRDGQLRFVDRTSQPASELEVAQLDFRASDLSPAEPVSFELGAALLAAERNFEASGTLGPLAAAAPSLDLELTLAPLLAERALALPAVRAALPEGLVASGPLRLAAQAQGSLEQLRFEARVDASAAALRLGDGLDKAAGVPCELSLRGSRAGDALDVESAELVFGKTKLRSKAQIASLAKPVVNFSASSEAVSLADFGAGAEGEVVRDLSLEGKLALPEGGPRLSASLASGAGRVAGADYRNLAADLAFANQRLEIAKAALEAFGGTLDARGSYDLGDVARPRFDLATRVEKVRIEEMLAARAPAVAQFISGELAANLDLAGAGSTWEQIKPLLSGLGGLKVADGVLKSFNPAGETLRGVAAIPALSGSGLARFLQAHPRAFGADDSPFEELAAKLQIRDGWVELPDLRLVLADYTIAGRGRYALANQLDFPLALALSPALSEELLAAESRMRYLRSPAGEVVFPFLVKGSLPKPAVVPDVQAVTQAVLREALIGDLIGKKLLGLPEAAPSEPAAAPESGAAGAGAPDSAAAPPAEEAPPPASKEEVRDQVIREGLRGLEGLLGGQKR